MQIPAGRLVSGRLVIAGCCFVPPCEMGHLSHHLSPPCPCLWVFQGASDQPLLGDRVLGEMKLYPTCLPHSSSRPALMFLVWIQDAQGQRKVQKGQVLLRMSRAPFVWIRRSYKLVTFAMIVLQIITMWALGRVLQELYWLKVGQRVRQQRISSGGPHLPALFPVRSRNMLKQKV